eukprot:3666292-Amphidinium_carterae.1
MKHRLARRVRAMVFNRLKKTPPLAERLCLSRQEAWHLELSPPNSPKTSLGADTVPPGMQGSSRVGAQDPKTRLNVSHA